MAEIPQKRDFLIWSIQNFVRKVKQFVRKYYITWLIDLANQLYVMERFFISFHAMCFFLNRLALLRNFVNKPVEQNSIQ